MPLDLRIQLIDLCPPALCLLLLHPDLSLLLKQLHFTNRLLPHQLLSPLLHHLCPCLPPSRAAPKHAPREEHKVDQLYRAEVANNAGSHRAEAQAEDHAELAVRLCLLGRPYCEGLARRPAGHKGLDDDHKLAFLDSPAVTCRIRAQVLLDLGELDLLQELIPAHHVCLDLNSIAIDDVKCDLSQLIVALDSDPVATGVLVVHIICFNN